MTSLPFLNVSGSEKKYGKSISDFVLLVSSKVEMRSRSKTAFLVLVGDPEMPLLQCERLSRRIEDLTEDRQPELAGSQVQ